MQLKKTQYYLTKVHYLPRKPWSLKLSSFISLSKLSAHKWDMTLPNKLSTFQIITNLWHVYALTSKHTNSNILDSKTVTFTIIFNVSNTRYNYINSTEISLILHSSLSLRIYLKFYLFNDAQVIHITYFVLNRRNLPSPLPSSLLQVPSYQTLQDTYIKHY